VADVVAEQFVISNGLGVNLEHIQEILSILVVWFTYFEYSHDDRKLFVSCYCVYN